MEAKHIDIYLCSKINISLLNKFLRFLGTPETMEILRKKLGVKIGSTTGYTKEIMAKLKVL